jgi:UDP-N-acetylmuramoyl-tripeptide--D-alanyl-D-alanine ligase
MKFLLKTLLYYYLKCISRVVLFIHRPVIIAIAGSINKSFFREAIAWQLREMKVDFRSNSKNFNTEIGLSLAILDLSSGYNSYKKWLPIIIKAPLKIFSINFSKFLILELGTSGSGDMRRLLSVVKPDIAIVTDITQRYLEGFTDINKLVYEYKYLAKKMKKSNFLVLNYDNKKVRELKNKTKASVKYFGINSEADCEIKDIKNEDNVQVVRIKHNQSESDYKMKYFGKHHAQALAVSLMIKNYVEEEISAL